MHKKNNPKFGNLKLNQSPKSQLFNLDQRSKKIFRLIVNDFLKTHSKWPKITKIAYQLLGFFLSKWQERFSDKSVDVVIPVPFTSNTAALSFATK